LILCGDQQSFSDAREQCATHRSIFTVNILTNFEHVLMYIGNYRMGIHNQFSLKRGQLAATKRERTKHTLKTTRILLSSDFQAAMVSVLSLA